MPSKTCSPRSFLKGRRPYLFSDTLHRVEPVLDRSVLEYHLDSLTSRSQEYDFQEFARRLAEAEICPNLLPQTGPTGGGDSKVDSETFPVADSLALAWYTGIGREGADERWAFAMSTKREWRAKVREDVEKIAKTGRGYSKAFFITSRYVRDRDRATLEDELRDKHGVDVRILDRTWILDRVFQNRREALAIEYLRMDVPAQQSIQKGPLDTHREQQLAEIEARIEELTQNVQFVPNLVDDCLEAAKIARGLELPRTEVEGRLLRAERMAERCGTPHQRLLVAYTWAWTAYFWYEDYLLFAKLYQQVETRAEGSTNPHELQLLTNLWQILLPAVKGLDIDAALVDFDARTNKLLDELDRLAQDEERASASMQARSAQLLMQLFLAATCDRDAILHELKALVARVQVLIGFPLEPLIESLMVLGDAFVDSQPYQDLFDFLVETTASRRSETAAARMLLRRGIQLLEAEKPSETIRTTGRALVKLFKHESRHELVVALYLLGVSYERLGLIWGARGMLLAAASIATQDLIIHGDVLPAQPACFHRLKWLELQLGRIPHALAWHELDIATINALASSGYQNAALEEGEEEFDLILGILLLRARLVQLRKLGGLAASLDNLGLFAASAALIYALGHEDKLPSELDVDVTNGVATQQYFLSWRDQLAAEDLPNDPSLCDEPEVILGSVILGCAFVVKAQNTPGCVAMGESILAVTECLLATGVADRLIALEPSMSILVRAANRDQPLVEFSLGEKAGLPQIEVSCAPVDPNHFSQDAQQEIKSKLVELLFTIMARVFPTENVEKLAAKMFGEERALERSVNFACSFVVMGNVHGDAPRTELASWLDSSTPQLSLNRQTDWDADAPPRQDATVDASSKPKVGTGPRPAGVLDATKTKHSEVRTISLIRPPLWERANWIGTGYIRTGRPIDPPVMVLIFENEEAAAEIFAHLREEVGADDKKERIRVTIVRGISREAPQAYRVVVGTNLSAVPADGLRYVAVGIRVNMMTPTSSQNLDAFLANYTSSGMYGLSYAIGEGEKLEPRFSATIAKRQLNVRQAWEVGLNDFDGVGIREDDDPIVPAGQTDPPVHRLLEKKKKRSIE